MTTTVGPPTACTTFAPASRTEVPRSLSRPAGALHTADKAMRAIRPGGVYLMMPHGICYALKLQRPPCLAAHAKRGVTQLNFDTGPDFGANLKVGLDRLARLIDEGAIQAPIDRTFAFEDISLAFNYSAGPGEGGVSVGHLGKISVVM